MQPKLWPMNKLNTTHNLFHETGVPREGSPDEIRPMVFMGPAEVQNTSER